MSKVYLCGACQEGRFDDCSGWCGVQFDEDPEWWLWFWRDRLVFKLRCRKFELVLAEAHRLLGSGSGEVK